MNDPLVTFRGINLKAVHLAFVQYVLRATDNTAQHEAYNGSAVQDEVLYVKRRRQFQVVKFKDAFITKQERIVVLRLLRATHGFGMRPYNSRKDSVPLSTLYKLCVLLGVNILQVLTFPVTYIKPERSAPEQPISLHGFVGCWI